MVQNVAKVDQRQFEISPNLHLEYGPRNTEAIEERHRKWREDYQVCIDIRAQSNCYDSERFF